MANDARELRDSLRRLFVAHGCLDDATRPCGTPVAMPHAHALLELMNAPEGLRVTQLAERLSIDRTNVSRLCKRMEEAGELVREIDPEDARARRLVLTEDGQSLAEQVDKASATYFDEISAQLGDRLDEVLGALALLHSALSDAEPAV